MPLTDNCCIIWDDCSEGYLNRILKLYKGTAIIIFDADPFSSSEPKKWMPVKS